MIYVIYRIEPEPLPGNIQEADAAQENDMELEVNSLVGDDADAVNNSSSECEVPV